MTEDKLSSAHQVVCPGGIRALIIDGSKYSELNSVLGYVLGKVAHFITYVIETLNGNSGRGIYLKMVDFSAVYTGGAWHNASGMFGM